MASCLFLQCHRLLQTPSTIENPSSSTFLLFSDLVKINFRPLQSSHIPFSFPKRRNLNPHIYPISAKRGGDAEESEWGDVVERTSSSHDSTISRFNSQTFTSTATDSSISLGIREPVYEVIEVRSDGIMTTKKINRRQLLKSSGLRLRDIRSVDPSLWLTNSMPSLLVRDQAILLNLGSLRAIAMRERVLVFDFNRKGGKAFLDSLLPRLNPRDANGGPCMPFELEVVEAALVSRIQRLEQKLMKLEPRVAALLEVLPNRLTADVLEQLRLSKQTLVELGSRAGALKQMLLDLLEDPHEIRRICVLGRNCSVRKGNVECSLPIEKQIAEDEEEEIEMLLENYLQRCESCHGQAERLLDSAKEMEDSIAVNLSSRRLEVSRVELLLQVGTFCVAVGALVAGIFGMNLKSYLEEHVFAFWLTTAGIIVGGVAAFFILYSYLRAKKIF
ncbi:magnesium (Mg) transporter 10 [Tasmannia lanceolata]|uniref:magnesium (Mg) transporter 10 n=1 Tax=Tasmannia lanceolata TaxID=3420 RepID=UPI004063DEEB